MISIINFKLYYRLYIIDYYKYIIVHKSLYTFKYFLYIYYISLHFKMNNLYNILHHAKKKVF